MKFFSSIHHALRGIYFSCRHEPHMRLHFFSSLLVIFLGFLFHLTRIEWVLSVLAMMFVIITELVNSAVERLADVVSPRLQPQMQAVKDMLAGAVFLAALGAIVIGLCIFLPYILVFIVERVGM